MTGGQQHTAAAAAAAASAAVASATTPALPVGNWQEVTACEWRWTVAGCVEFAAVPCCAMLS